MLYASLGLTIAALAAVVAGSRSANGRRQRWWLRAAAGLLALAVIVALL